MEEPRNDDVNNNNSEATKVLLAYTILIIVTSIFALLAIWTLVPQATAGRISVLGYKTHCPFAPWSTLICLACSAITFTIMYLIWKYWTFIIGAGYETTPDPIIRKMLELAEVTEKDIFYDLGSGKGNVVCLAAEEYNVRCVGIEADPLRYMISRIKVAVKGLSCRVQLRFGNFFTEPLEEATVVTLFLFQSANNRLKDKLVKELKPGTRIVSYTWTFDGWTPDHSLPLERIYLYTIKQSGNDYK
ncbi:MAG: hypothetical protein PHD13_04585 [Methanocellales archaeon]|nr:hypothetical protein [Methanocellales archaeon]MDD3291257.1 hypothetical protein [Methanocellales archaeon]MDD5235429.1 hypothetical protein [Methanocellales archaeon]MDD5484488.1 hypothetical protein [Methanocellales archaeon]